MVDNVTLKVGIPTKLGEPDAILIDEDEGEPVLLIYTLEKFDKPTLMDLLNSMSSERKIVNAGGLYIRYYKSWQTVEEARDKSIEFAEKYSVRLVEFNGYTGTLGGTEHNLLHWVTEDCDISMGVSKAFDQEELIENAKSIKTNYKPTE